MQDMEESEIETRIRILEDIEIPHVRNEYNKALHEFLDAGYPLFQHIHTDKVKSLAEHGVGQVMAVQLVNYILGCSFLFLVGT